MEKIWYKKFPEDVPRSVTYPKVPIFRFLEDSARKYPQNLALHFMGKEITYSQLSELVDRFAAGLARLGVKKGDRVALFLPNCPQCIIAYYGTLKAGAIVVQTNPLYVERELEHQLNNSSSETIVTLDMRVLLPKVLAVKNKTPLKRIIISNLSEYLPFPKNILFSIAKKKDLVPYEKKEGIYLFADLMKSPPTPPEVKVSSDEIALLQYTGGTTGVSKGVMLTHDNLVANAIQCRVWFSRAEDGKERMLAVLPFFHSFAMTVCMNISIYSGFAIILLPKFELKEVIHTIHSLKPTVFPGVPTMYVAINNYPGIKDIDISSIKFCISGAAPLPVDVCEKFEALTGGKLVEGYGLTETTPVTHANPLYGLRKIGSIGLPVSDTEIKIVNLEDNTKELSIGEIGELAVKGPQVMKGYWNMPDDTASTVRDGWLFTGDIAKVDEDGYTYIVDRKKDMIITGGFNIYPRDIEEVLYTHPKIKEVVAAGIPDQYKGEIVKIYIVLKDGESATKEEIIEFCKKNLARYKIPEIVEFRRELPKTLVGKILRRVLVEEEMKKS